MENKQTLPESKFEITYHVKDDETISYRMRHEGVSDIRVSIEVLISVLAELTELYDKIKKSKDELLEQEQSSL